MRRHVRFAPFAQLGSLLLVLLVTGHSLAAISYTTIGSNFTENFDALPNTPQNASLQATIPWTDDSTSSATQTSLPGWYLYHSASQTEGGANGHQRMRIGAGTATTGAFMSWGGSGSTERALGNLTSNTIGVSDYALRLVNNTGSTLGEFTLSYTAEQWRDGGATSPAVSIPQSVTFGYAVTSTPPANVSALSVTSIAALGFTSPTFGATAAVALDGNLAANQVALGPITVSGINWGPGQDLWLRWTDIDHAGNDHGMGIDNLTFSAAVGLPPDVNSVTSGLASSPSTWSDNLVPSVGKTYHVISGHTVTLDAQFDGTLISVENGTVDINAGGSGQFFQKMVVETNGNLTESVSGDVAIGNNSANSELMLNRDLAFSIDAGTNFRLNSKLTGAGNLEFNSAANGQLFLDNTQSHTGIIRFNGAGKQVNVVGSTSSNAAVAKLEMNSTGENILWWEPTVTANAGTVTFNQPGSIVHATSTIAANARLQGPGTLVANAPVTVDLSMTYARDERRFLLGAGFQSTANVTVKGTSTDPTDASGANGTGITLNEFEVGAQGTDPAATSFEPYSGTISTVDYVNMEVRRNLPAAKIVVNENGRLETGAQVISSTNGTRIGEVVVAGGGVLEVGFEQANAQSSVFVEGHHANHLKLVKSGGRNGGLTLTGGVTPSTLRMQINGISATEFDRIEAQGNVSVDGTLNVLINPPSCTGNDPCGANGNATWSPNIGDTFDIIKIVATPAVGDYDASGTVDGLDYDAWRNTFGDSVAAGTAADGNANGVVDAADYAIWRRNVGATSGINGAVSGTFDNLSITDPLGSFSGFAFQVNYSTTAVQLQVVSPSGAGAGGAVPEPSLATLMGVSILVVSSVRRRRD